MLTVEMSDLNLTPIESLIASAYNPLHQIYFIVELKLGVMRLSKLHVLNSSEKGLLFYSLSVA